MKTCWTCKYWGNHSVNRAPPHFRGCDCPKHCTGYHVDHVPDDGMLAEDDEGWGFVTGPDFGCVNHEPK